VLSELLSCISSMFVVVLDCPDALNPILHKIFSALSTGMAIIKKLLFENRKKFLGQRSKLVIPCAYLNLVLNQDPHSLQWLDPDPGLKFTLILKTDQKKHVQNFLGFFSLFFP
jgi:hypothetical protein